MKIWETYFLKQLIKVFFLFIGCFYGLYILIDFSSHAAAFHTNHIQVKWLEMIHYYLSDFIKRLEVLVPFALMIATIKTLCSLNVHNELVAMMASGVKRKRLLQPFLFFAFAWTLLLYANTEFLLPEAMKTLKHIDDSHANQRSKYNQIEAVQHLILEDQSPIIFKNYDRMRKMFVDAYWIRSSQEIYRIQHLFPYGDTPKGEYVDQFVRDKNHRLIRKASLESISFPEMHFNKERLIETLTHAEDLSLSDLTVKLPKASPNISEKEAQILTVFYYKMTLPWLCVLTVIAAAPFCIHFTRRLPVFFIYAGCIFGLVALYLILDASLVLGKRQLIPPFAAIALPFSLFFAFFTIRYIRVV